MYIRISQSIVLYREQSLEFFQFRMVRNCLNFEEELKGGVRSCEILACQSDHIKVFKPTLQHGLQIHGITNWKVLSLGRQPVREKNFSRITNS